MDNKIQFEITEAEKKLIERIRQMNCGKIIAFVGNGCLLRMTLETSLKFKNNADSQLRS